jgi:hypothetical protein
MPSIFGSRFAPWVQKRWYPAWWLKHEFDTDAAAPLGSPYTGSGAGALVVVDANSKLSASGGKLLFATGGSASGNPAIFGAQQTRTAGRGFVGILNRSAADFEFGWTDAQSGTTLKDALRFNATVNVIRDNGTVVDMGIAITGSPMYFAFIQRTAGFWAFFKGVGFPVWRLLWIGTGSTANYYPGAMVQNTTTVVNIDTMRGCDFGAPFDTDYGFATQRLSGARAANDVIVHNADFFAEWVQTTLPSSGNTDIRFRVVDSSNYIQALVSSTGALTLNTVTAGTPTQIATSAAAVAAGNRVVVSMDGSTIRSYAASVAKATGTGSSFTTQPNGVISALGTGGAVSDLCTWPIYPSSEMMQMLNMAVLS